MKYKGILVITATSLAGLSLAACGHGSIVNPPHGKVVVASSTTSSITNQDKNEASFNNNIIKTNNFQIKITSMTIVRHSIATKNKTLLRLTYKMTNYHTAKLQPAMITDFISAYQTINNKKQQLNTGVTLYKDQSLVSQQNHNIKKNNSADGVITFELIDYANNVNLVAKDDKQIIGSKVIQPTQLTIINDVINTPSSITKAVNAAPVTSTTTPVQTQTIQNTTSTSQRNITTTSNQQTNIQ